LARALADFLALRRSTSLHRPVQRANIRAHLRDARYRGRIPPYTTDAAYSPECLDSFTELLCRRVVQSVASEDGRLDILVNAAGGNATVGGLMDLDDGRWQADIDKLLGYPRMVRAASQEYPEVQV
jgi:NAD(P)-dependent dehydrogenase (short-subunit alcohol dehydrogenase family)